MKKLIFTLVILCIVKVSSSQTQLSRQLTHALDSAFLISGGTNVTATLLDRNGMVWQHATGINSAMAHDTLLPSYLMGIGSITKTYTSTLMLLLQENNQLSLDDSIYHYLPEFTNVNPNITLRQLLNHSSGIYDFFNDPTTTIFDSVFNDPSRIWMPAEVITKFVGAAYFEPGTLFAYSNTNYLLAQLIIENVTGNSYQKVLRDKILNPLSLSHTYYFPFEIPQKDTIAHAWYDIDGDGITDDITAAGFPLDGFFSAAGAAGAIISSSGDVAKFMSHLLNGHILSGASLHEMLDTVPQKSYGLGIFRGPAICDNGWGHEGDLVYKSFCMSYDDGNYTLAIQTSDDKNLPGIQSAFYAVMNVYCHSSNTSNIDETKPAAYMVLFPNPAKDNLTVRYEGSSIEDKRIIISDAFGREIIFISVAGHETTIDTSALPNGIYQVQIIDNSQITSTQKLSISK